VLKTLIFLKSLSAKGCYFIEVYDDDDDDVDDDDDINVVVVLVLAVVCSFILYSIKLIVLFSWYL
jgi:hypothetical protein